MKKLLAATIMAFTLASVSLCWADADWEPDCWIEDEKEEQLFKEYFGYDSLPEDWTTRDIHWESASSGYYRFAEIFSGEYGTVGSIMTPGMAFERIDGAELSECDEYVSFSFLYYFVNKQNILFWVEAGFSQSPADDWIAQTDIQWTKIWEYGVDDDWIEEDVVPWSSVEEDIPIYFSNSHMKNAKIYLRFNFQSEGEFRMYLDNVQYGYKADIEYCEGYSGPRYHDDGGEIDHDNDNSLCSISSDSQSAHFGLTAIMLLIGVSAMFLRRR